MVRAKPNLHLEAGLLLLVGLGGQPQVLVDVGVARHLLVADQLARLIHLGLHTKWHSLVSQPNETDLPGPFLLKLISVIALSLTVSLHLLCVLDFQPPLKEEKVCNLC